MDNKDIDFRYKYFTFPLKFLHVPPAGYKIRFDLILRWSIYEFLRRQTFDPETSVEEKERWISKVLDFDGGSLDSWQAGWQTLQKLIEGREMYTSVRTSYLFEARDGELDPNLLLLVAAVRSIIGPKRRFVKTNRLAVVGRMYGNPDRMTRYKFDKLCDTAVGRGMLSRIPAGRGFYVSIRYDVDKLVSAVESRVNKEKTIRQQQVEAGRRIAMLKLQWNCKLKKNPQLIYN